MVAVTALTPEPVWEVSFEPNAIGGLAGNLELRDLVVGEYRSLVEIGDTDQVVVALDVRSFRRCAFGLDGCRVLPGHGPDGTHKCVLESAPLDRVIDRFDRVVVANRNSLSRAQAAAADEVRLLPQRTASASKRDHTQRCSPTGAVDRRTRI